MMQMATKDAGALNDAEQELIWHVDEHDNPIGPIDRSESRKIGARYRMVRVSVEDADGNILLQKRLATKKSYPGCWDTSAGGNITYPEAYDEAVQRELAEEIGLRDVELEEVAHFYGEIVDPAGNKMNRFTKVYRTVVDPSTTFTPQPSEVSEVKWMSRADVVKLAEGEEITDGLRQVIEKYYRKGGVET